MLSQARPGKQYFYLRPKLNLFQRRERTVKETKKTGYWGSKRFIWKFHIQAWWSNLVTGSSPWISQEGSLTEVGFSICCFILGQDGTFSGWYSSAEKEREM